MIDPNIIGALITAAATLIAAGIGIGRKKKSRENSAGALHDESSTSDSGTAGPPPSTTAMTPRYEVVKELGVQKTFLDPETGLLLAVDYFVNDQFGIPKVRFRYTPRGGTQIDRTARHGETFAFTSSARSFFLIIEAVDRKKGIAQFRIQEH
jgi:hypothetical protein